MKVNFYLDKKSNPKSENGMKVVYGKTKRGGYRLRWYLILAIVISPLLFMAYYLFRTQVLISAPAIITSNPLTITATQSAIVETVPVEVGAEIQLDQPLVSLRDNALNKEIKFIEEELLKLSEHQVDHTDDIYRAAITKTETSLKKVKQVQQRYDKYRKQGQVSEVDYVSVINISNALNNQLSNQKIAHLEAVRNAKQLELAGPVAQEHRALMRELVVKQTQQQNLTFGAPFKGRVLDTHVREGERISANAPLLTIARNETPEITAFLHPKHLEYSQLNTQASVVFPDGQKFAATISRPVEVVRKLPQELQNPLEGQPAYLKVSLSFDEPLERSRWVEGVEVEVRFDINLDTTFISETFISETLASISEAVAK